MIVFRICKWEFRKDLSGEGAKLYGGRWNSVDIPMIYTAGSISLCVLEFLVHTQPAHFPRDLILLHLKIDESILPKRLLIPKLPIEWHNCPFPPSTQKIGDKFIRSKNALVLKIPSVIVPQEHNYLINPTHPDAKKIRIVKSEPLQMDLRLIP